MPDESQGDKSLEERVAALEARIENVTGWRNPVWLGAIATAVACVFTIIWTTHPWKLFEHHRPAPKPTVKLIQDHAAAYAKEQWNANLRVLNDTRRSIVVERVTAVFGKASYGQGCNGKAGSATQVLYPESAQPTRHPHVEWQTIPPGGGAPFQGGPNLNVLFSGKRCPLAVAKLQLPQDRVTYTVFTDNGRQWRLRSTVFYQPRAQVQGGGGGSLCLPLLPLLGC